MTSDDIKNMAHQAKRALRHEDRETCLHYPEHCSACVLAGHGELDVNGQPCEETGMPAYQPNYAGWARVYVEGSRRIPYRYRCAFESERDRQDPYGVALRRSIDLFGPVRYEPEPDNVALGRMSVDWLNGNRSQVRDDLMAMSQSQAIRVAFALGSMLPVAGMEGPLRLPPGRDE